MAKAGLLKALHDTSFVETAVEKLLALNGKVCSLPFRLTKVKLYNSYKL